MSRQYLKQLQERAQRLLELSSEDEQINAYTATHGRTISPRPIAHDFLHEDPPSDPESQPIQPTDVEMMKKCIHLSNENSSLRQQLERQLVENEELKRLLRTKGEMEKSFQERIEQQREERDGRREREMSKEWEKERETINTEKFLIKKQQEEIERQKRKLEKEREQLEALKVSRLKSNPPEIDFHQQYTIKPQKTKPDQTERLRFKLEESQEKMKQLEGMIRQQKAKNAKLCQFINRQVPQLKDMMVQITAKLDNKVEKYLLRDHAY